MSLMKGIISRQGFINLKTSWCFVITLFGFHNITNLPTIRNHAARSYPKKTYTFKQPPCSDRIGKLCYRTIPHITRVHICRICSRIIMRTSLFLVPYTINTPDNLLSREVTFSILLQNRLSLALFELLCARYIRRHVIL